MARLWGHGLFSSIRVEEVPGPGGIRLRYALAARPLIRHIDWEGESGLDIAEVVAVAGLAIGEEISQARLAQAERDMLTRYQREGYLAARAILTTKPVPNSAERDVVVFLNSGDQARVGTVAIEGDTGLPRRQIDKALKLDTDDPYRESLARDGARAAEERLRQEGYYEARVTLAPPDWRRENNRVDLTFRVAAGPRYRVEFEGREALPESVLKAQLTFPASGTVDQFEQQASAQQIAAAYRERGYHFATVTVAESRDADAPVIRFAIDEGPRVTVEGVAFTGHFTGSSERLAKQIETRPPGLFHRGLFRQDVLDRDVGVLLAHLRSLGYAEARVGPPEVTLLRRPRARADLHPDRGGPEGSPWARSSSRAITSSRLARSRRPCRSSAALPYEARLVEDGQRAIERLYSDRGYNGAVVRSETSRQGSTVDMRYDIDEGEQTRIGRVLLRGLLLARESVVRRTLPFRSGDVLVPRVLLDGQRRLGEFPAFDSVSVDPLRPPPDPFADVEVTLRERKPWHLDFGLGYSNADGARGFIELGHDDVFGSGASLSIRQRLSAGGESTGDAQRTDVIGRVPYVLGTPWWIDVDLFQETSSQLGYDLQQAGIWVDVHRELFPELIKGLRGDLRYRLESVRFSNVDPTLVTSDVTAGAHARQQPDAHAHARPPRRAARSQARQLSPGLGGDGHAAPRQRRAVRQELARDALVLRLAAADGRRGQRAARAGRAVRRHAEPLDPGPVLRRRSHHRARVPRGSARSAGRTRQPDGRERDGHRERGAAVPHLAVVRGRGVRRQRHRDAGDRRSDAGLVQERGRRRAAGEDAGGPGAGGRGVRAPVHDRRLEASRVRDGGESVLRRAAGALAFLALVAATASGSAAGARLADAVLAELGTAPVMLSDVALARMLGVLGLTPSAAPITESDLSRYLDALLAEREAAQLEIEVPAADLDRAWQAAGGAALAARLEAAGIGPAWARRLIEANLRVEKFMDLRFRAFAFVTDFDVDEALGPGTHSEAAREKTRERLRAEMINRAFASWKEDARQRTPVKRIPGMEGPWAPPF